MPKISNKGILMPASPIRKLVPYADAAKERGIHVYHLNIGQPDIETPAIFWDKIKHIDRTILEYSPSDGYVDLKKKYASFLSQTRKYAPIKAEELLITTGGSEALLFTFLSILDAGDEMIIPEPMYANYVGFARSGNIEIKALTCHFEDEFRLPATEAFEALITPKTKAILICNPNNPTGYVYSNKEIERLGKIAKEHDLFLIVDEVYREFIYDNDEHLSVLDLPGLEENAILIDSVSKRFSACGARIGAIVTRNKNVIATALKFAQQRLSPPTLAQIGCNALFDVEETYFKTVNDRYKKRRDLIYELLNAIDGVKCHSPKGAFYTIAQLPVKDADHFCQWLLESFELNGETVMLAPGSGFYSTPGLGKNEVRLAYVLKKESIIKAVACLKEALRKYNSLF
ncbi:MAG: pyridoxal phosphate-dependent aminotransferase [Bacteroidetes bacterium]|nr:pyridoxal phosphate-dependent aminotransferase [Bacteroidota bacterium]